MFFRNRRPAVQLGCIAAALILVPGLALPQGLVANRKVRSTVFTSPGEPPKINGNAYLAGEMPKFSFADPAFGTTLAGEELLLARADEAFQTGKRFYRLGNLPEARIQFDRTMDLYMKAFQRTKDRTRLQPRFDEMVDSIYRLELTGMEAAIPAQEPRFEKSPLEDILPLTFPVDPKLKSKVKAELQATVSQLPLTTNDAVLGFIQYFAGRGYRTLVSGLERAGRYRPMVQRILSEEGVPQELIHLAQAESGFYPRAVSRMRATGMWQFMAFRGKQYGLDQTQWADDRLDPEKATRAAARHLRDLYDQFGDWYLAIAGYNCGPMAVERAVERTGYADFWRLRAERMLPLETSNYVPIILAMTIMTKNAKEYGLEGVVPQPPLDYDVVEMTSATHLALIADLTETPVSQIQDLNPALLRNIAPLGYALRVPKSKGDMVASILRTVPAERRASWRVHRVGGGDTLATIGKQYGEAPTAIARVNQLEPGDPPVGELLLIPKTQSPRIEGRTPARPVLTRGKSASARTTARPHRRTPAAAKAARPRGVQTASNRSRRG